MEITEQRVEKAKKGIKAKVNERKWEIGYNGKIQARNILKLSSVVYYTQWVSEMMRNDFHWIFSPQLN